MNHALIMILAKAKSNTFHPICYIEDLTDKKPGCIIYKSKRHHKEGFDNRYMALLEAGKMQVKLLRQGYTCRMETHRNMIWKGDNEPSDRQIRPSDLEKEDHVNHLNCTAQCILQTELRERLGCVILVQPSIHNGQMVKYNWWRFYEGEIESSYNPLEEDMGEYDSYEEALQAGIEEAFYFLEQ